MYYQSQLSFEEVVLKFLQVEGNDGLKTFLRKKLESLSNRVRSGDLSSKVRPGDQSNKLRSGDLSSKVRYLPP